MKILCLLCDIFFIPEIQKVLTGHSLEFVQSYDNRVFDFLVLDMDHAESFELCRKYPEKSICFGSHADTDGMKRFRETGCAKVFPRSVFLERLKEINQKKG